MTRAIVLDSGALLAVDRRGRDRVAELKAVVRRGDVLVTHPFVTAQVWRGGKQAELARFLNGVDVRTIDGHFGRRCGELLGKAGTSDPVDAAVVLLAEDGDRILTSDPDDIERLVNTSERKVRVVRV
ncbi:hypothetical protein [Phytoactinopolyspora endophytica]|uniref:hypothetical protein n=1 Tax=Phytoactinopolyspora endophytica TaxID=1642495 RepID=UPI00197C7A6C|nr:hypothetical protein [Phytoactinopolyspora endophytica]